MEVGRRRELESGMMWSKHSGLIALGSEVRSRRTGKNSKYHKGVDRRLCESNEDRLTVSTYGKEVLARNRLDSEGKTEGES